MYIHNEQHQSIHLDGKNVISHHVVGNVIFLEQIMSSFKWVLHIYFYSCEA